MGELPGSMLGCKVDEALFERWSALLVSDPAPYFLNDDARSLLPAHQMIFTRQEFSANFADIPLEMRDSYRTSAINPEATWVTLIDDRTFASLPKSTRDALDTLQWQLGRGQVYDMALLRAWLSAWPDALAQIEQLSFPTAGGAKFALQADFWRSLPAAAKAQWLIAFIAQDRESCLSSELSPATWEDIERHRGPQVRALAGSFATRSGPCCFGTTLAALSPDLLPLADLWVHQGPFLRVLDQRGYRPQPVPDDLAQLPSGSVLVWEDAVENPQHACCVVSPGLALNKDAQCWFAPRQILPLERIIAGWIDDDLRLRLYLPL